jgi:3-oxoacyl-[acyl-carrier protein] reductase
MQVKGTEGELRGKTAFISGAGRNIGRAIALELASRSCSLVLNGLGKRSDCEATADEARRLGAADVMVAMGNVGDRAFMREMADGALKRFGSVDIVVNNAGVRPHTPFLDLSDDEWQSIMDVNLNAAFHACKAFLPGMSGKGWGRVISITGRTSIEGYSERVPVSVSKHGLWGLTKALAKEFGPKGVTSNAISPGVVRRSDVVSAEMARRNAERAAEIPLGRIGEPEDIAALAGFLCSDRGSFINGQMIASNGGAAT